MSIGSFEYPVKVEIGSAFGHALDRVHEYAVVFEPNMPSLA